MQNLKELAGADSVSADSKGVRDAKVSGEGRVTRAAWKRLEEISRVCTQNAVNKGVVGLRARNCAQNRNELGEPAGQVLWVEGCEVTWTDWSDDITNYDSAKKANSQEEVTVPGRTVSSPEMKWRVFGA